MTNIDYYVLCVLEFRPKFNSGEPFYINEVARHCDIDKSEASKSLKTLKKYGFITLITKKPLTYTFNGIKLK